MQDVINAYRAISHAEQNYRATLRAALADGTKQSEIAKALDLTRETIRRDAMDEERREALRQSEIERLRKRREVIKRAGRSDS